MFAACVTKVALYQLFLWLQRLCDDDQGPELRDPLSGCWAPNYDEVLLLEKVAPSVRKLGVESMRESMAPSISARKDCFQKLFWPSACG